MKNLFTISTLIFGMFFTFISCQKDDTLIKDEILIETEDMYIRKVTNTEIINEFKSRITTLKSSESIVFDTENIFEVGLSASDPKVLIANQVGFDECNDSNFGFTIAIDDNGNFGQTAIVKTENVDEQIKIINYYDDSNNLILSLKLNANSESIETLFKQPILKSTGQNVADCVGDAYTKHGWVSVWAFVQTAFIPATAAAIAGACLAVNL